jgi:MazG nucleotide pyrophosphohydrolase domain.
MKDQQRRAEEFAEENDLDAPTPFRLLDLASELGEIAKDATKTAEYGEKPGQLEVKQDEIGDLLFSLFMVCDSLDVDAQEAFDEAMRKYEERVENTGEPGSGS